MWDMIVVIVDYKKVRSYISQWKYSMFILSSYAHRRKSSKIIREKQF